MKLLALIPARGGSKGIPKKNIRPFAGKPLIAHSIEAGRGSKYVDRVIVSTDDPEIAEISRSFGAEVPVTRPAEIAGDESPVMDAVIHTLDYLRDQEGYEPTHLLLLQTTSPLRRSSDIDAAVALFKERDAESLVSMCRTENGLYTIDEDDAVHIEYDGYTTSNRQMLPTCYRLDGCMLYLIDVKVLREKKSFLAGKLVSFIVPRWTAVDLDDPEDFIVGELLYAHREEIEQKIKNFLS
jgi:N-acylneuraminate cytidylyltransferase/CMP-N,N'-diacetyllegionaminic acid synthase